MRRPWGSATRTAVAATALLVGAGSAALVSAVDSSSAAGIPGPVCIPGEATLPVTADAKVSKAHPYRNYGKSSRWKVNYGPSTLRSFIDFDLPPMPLGCSVKKAMLELSGKESGHPHPASEWPGAYLNFSLAGRRWSESRLTWNNMPLRVGCFGWFQDITLAVQDAYRCLDSGRLAEWNGLKLRGRSPTGRRAHWRFAVDSRESARPPVVHVTWDYDEP
jgi:hypothetical protein